MKTHATGDKRKGVGSAEWWQDQSLRRAPLTLDRIVAAALQIIERDGADAVTMRRLGDELGTSPASLYRHVENRTALMLHVSEAILAEVDVADDPSQPWQERTAQYAYAIRRALGRHPGRASYFLGPHSPGPEALSLFHEGMQVYLDAGFSRELATSSIQSIIFLIRSFVTVEVEWPESVVVAPESLVPAARDRFRSARLVDGPGSERPTDELFDFLLAATIDGIAQRLVDAEADRR